MTRSMEEKVQWLMDREEIREVFETFFYLIDNDRRAEVPERCFTEDSVTKFPSNSGGPPVEVRGWEERRKFVLINQASVDRTVHNMTQMYVEINGDTAYALVTLETLLWMKESENRDLNRPADSHIFVQHHNDLRRTPEGWRIASRWMQYRQPHDEGIPRLVELAVEAGYK